jgi:putative methyltransferase (TIGR04325 family)
MMTISSLVRLVLPPPVRQWLRERLQRWNGRAEWEYIPEGWQAIRTNPAIKGWNERSILDMYRTHWPAFVRHIEGTGPLGFWYEAGDTNDGDLTAHNIYMSYAYALARAAHQHSKISLLDWGGGIGHYYLVSRRLMPQIQLEYHCKDMPILIEHGRTLFPEASFYSDDSCLSRQYDLVLASGSLHYSQSWRPRLTQLARSTRDYLFVTRLPVIVHSPSFVFVQRPYRYGYQTEYLGWCLNRKEFLEHAERSSLKLVHECRLGEAPKIYRAPEQNEYRGFLFQKVH